MQKVITGSIGRVGKTYTIDISYIDIRSAQIEKSFNRDYRGEVDGLLPILKEIATEIAVMNLPPPEVISKTPLYISGITTLSFLSFATYSFFKAENSYDKYQQAKTGELVRQYRDDTKTFDKFKLISGIAAGASVAFFLIYLNKYNKSKKPKGVFTSLYLPNPHTVGVALVKNF